MTVSGVACELLPASSAHVKLAPLEVIVVGVSAVGIFAIAQGIVHPHGEARNSTDYFALHATWW